MHKTTITVRWGELDPYNHVNHAVYSSYLEHARVAALEDLDTGMDELARSGLRIVVVRSEIRFRKPATAGDQLTIGTTLVAMRAAKMTWGQTIDRSGERIVDAVIDAAFIDSGGRPMRIPDQMRSLLGQLS